MKFINRIALLTVLSLTTASLVHAAQITVKSPNKKVRATISVNDSHRLQLSVTRNKKKVLENILLGTVIDGKDIGENAAIAAKGKITKIKESYPWFGVKSEIKNHCNYLVLPIKNDGSDKTWNLEVKAFNDGIAFRYVVPGSGDRKVNSETTSFGLTKGSKIWYRLNKPQYERFSKFSDVEKIEADYNMQLPVTIELPDNMGHIAITEAGSFLYSGLSLKSTGSTHLKAYFAGDSKGWTITGEIASPWRIIMTGPTLNDLVNCDIVPNVCPDPDPKLFPKGKMTEWIQPGRSLWNWWAYGKDGVAWKDQKHMIDQAQKLNCQYYLVDYGWEEPAAGWYSDKQHSNDRWDRLKELVKYAEERNVKILIWRHWHTLRSAKAQDKFFATLKDCGVKGAKIDFLASEGVDRRKFVIDVLKVAAKYQIMANFHGAPKPTGESKTWPNEITREGLIGLEHNRLGDPIPRQHYALMPFIRCLAGHGDFTPTTFQKAKLCKTTFTLQLAMAIVEDSPILCWADKPEIYLESPALTFIKSMPCVWDETIILPDSKMGEFVVMARRSGSDWYLAVMNASDNNKEYSLNLDFLKKRKTYSATYSRDDMERPDNMIIEKDITVKRGQTITMKMLPGGGFVARFTLKK